MKDLQKLINKKFEDYFSEKFEAVIEKNIEDMMDNVMKNVFSRTWGEDNIPEKIQKQIEERLEVKIDNETLQSYNWMIANSIGNYLTKEIEAKNLRPINKIVETIIGKSAKEDINWLDNFISKLRELIEAGIEDDYHRKADDIWKEYSIFAEYDEKKGRLEVWVSDTMGLEKYQCKYKFLIWKNHNTIFSISTNLEKEQVFSSSLRSYINRLYVTWTKINIERDELEDWEIDLDLWIYENY